MMAVLATLLSLASALVFYLCSARQRMRASALSTGWRWLAWLLAALSTTVWIAATGTGAGISAALTSLMLSCVLLPYGVWWRESLRKAGTP